MRSSELKSFTYLPLIHRGRSTSTDLRGNATSTDSLLMCPLSRDSVSCISFWRFSFCPESPVAMPRYGEDIHSRLLIWHQSDPRAHL